MNPVDKFRDEIFNDSAVRLSEKAHRAIAVLGLDPSEVVTVAIHVDDQAWRDVVDALMPDEDWQQYRDRGEMPIARGSVRSEGLLDYISVVAPAVSRVVAKPAPPGHLYALVMAGGGVTIYTVPWTEALK